MTLPQRTEQHRIDTRAVRRVLADLPENWLVRSVEERDYGVDLQIERFTGDDPTGQIAHIQVKGATSAGDAPLKLGGFPVKTINYSRLFSAPFFVFYVALDGREVRFVWLQKYADGYLAQEQVCWESQGTTTLTFPASNILSSKKEKIELIMDRYSLREKGLLFLRHASEFRWIWDDVMSTRPLIPSVDREYQAIVSAAIRNIDELRENTKFLQSYGGEDLLEMLKEGRKVIELYRYDEDVSDKDIDIVSRLLDELDVTSRVFLTEREREDFEQEACVDAEKPY